MFILYSIFAGGKHHQKRSVVNADLMKWNLRATLWKDLCSQDSTTPSLSQQKTTSSTTLQVTKIYTVMGRNTCRSKRSHRFEWQMQSVYYKKKYNEKHLINPDQMIITKDWNGLRAIRILIWQKVEKRPIALICVSLSTPWNDPSSAMALQDTHSICLEQDYCWGN